mgnify:CR=1 FL=1
MKLAHSIKFLLAGTAIVVAGFAAANAIGNVSRVRNPVLAAMVAPTDGRVLANLSDAKVQARLAKNRPGEEPPPLAAEAREALRLEPLNSIALRLLALDYERRDRIASTRKLIGLSEAVSRRDGATQLWLIMDSAKRRDVNAFVRHADILLRTQPEAGPTIAPILNQAMEDPAFRQAMLPYVRKKSPWIPNYLNFASTNARRPDAFSKLMRASGGVPDGPARQETETNLLRRLVDLGLPDEALSFFPLMKGSQARIVDTLIFSRASTDPKFAPIAWEALSPNATVATFDEERGNRFSLNVVASSGERGIVARKMLSLKPGSYRFFQNVAMATAGDRYPFAGWRLRCVDAEASQPIWRSTGDWQPVGKRWSAGPTVPASCPVQMLEFEVSGGLAGEGIELSIASVELQRTGAAAHPTASRSGTGR